MENNKTFTQAEVDAMMADREARDKNRKAAEEAEARAKAAEEELAKIRTEKAEKDFESFLRSKQIVLDDEKLNELKSLAGNDIEKLQSIVELTGMIKIEKDSINNLDTKKAAPNNGANPSKPEPSGKVDKDNPLVKAMMR